MDPAHQPSGPGGSLIHSPKAGATGLATFWAWLRGGSIVIEAAWIAIGMAIPLLGLFVWPRLRPALYVWPDEPRESRHARRKRLFQSYVGHARETADLGHIRDARYWIRRARRIDASHPDALAAMGDVEYRAGRYELALEYLDRAYMATIEGDVCRPDLPDGLEGEIAVTAAKACAYLRNECHDAQEREVWAERILAWSRIAADDDPDHVESLVRCPVLRELQEQVLRLYGEDARWWGMQ